MSVYYIVDARGRPIRGNDALGRPLVGFDLVSGRGILAKNPIRQVTTDVMYQLQAKAQEEERERQRQRERERQLRAVAQAQAQVHAYPPPGQVVFVQPAAHVGYMRVPRGSVPSVRRK